MDYVRNHYKVITFDVFKTRANFINDDLYVILKEMIEELYNMFKKYDKFIKYDIKIYDPVFVIEMRFKKNKIFDKLYTRFSAIVILLGYSETYKISILKRLIIIKFRLQILNGIIFSYR